MCFLLLLLVVVVFYAPILRIATTQEIFLKDYMMTRAELLRDKATKCYGSVVCVTMGQTRGQTQLTKTETRTDAGTDAGTEEHCGGRGETIKSALKI